MPPMWKGPCIGRLVALIMLAIGSIAGMTAGSRAHAETMYTPAVSLSQRYDSNVFYAPKRFVPAGKQRWDLVTEEGIGLKIQNKSRIGDTELEAWVNGNEYAYNTYLSYASTYVRATSDVSDWMQELLPGLKLRLNDAFQFTPEPPAFLAGGKPQESDVFARGVQGSRANTYSNIFDANGGYSISRSVGLMTNYSYSIRKVASFNGTSTFVSSPQFAYFDTTVHSVATGPTYTFDGGDTLFVKYNYMTADSSRASGGGNTTSFTAHTIQPEYVTTLARGWKATLSGGGTVIEQAGNRAFFSGQFGLRSDFDRRTRVSVSVSRKTTPSFFGTGGALISNVVQLYLGHDLSRLLTLRVDGSYAHNETATGNQFRIETIYGSAALDYHLTRSMKVSLAEVYQHFSYTGAPNFDRYATTLTLIAEWK